MRSCDVLKLHTAHSSLLQRATPPTLHFCKEQHRPLLSAISPHATAMSAILYHAFLCLYPPHSSAANTAALPGLPSGLWARTLTATELVSARLSGVSDHLPLEVSVGRGHLPSFSRTSAEARTPLTLPPLTPFLAFPTDIATCAQRHAPAMHPTPPAHSCSTPLFVPARGVASRRAHP